MAQSRRTPSTKSSTQPPQSHRKLVVFVALVGALTFTSALLLALAPDSLRPDTAQKSLFATDDSQSFDILFDTAAPIQQGRWKYLFVHQSRTPTGDAISLAQSPDGVPDHFVIGNGQGCGDGEIQITQRWTDQNTPGQIPGLPPAQPNFVSICLVGDFNATHPTTAQSRRLTALLTTLQKKLGIPAENVVLSPKGAGIAGIGLNFPVNALRTQLVR